MYEDLFATKGLEYIFILLFLIAFIFYNKWINTIPKKKIKKPTS